MDPFVTTLLGLGLMAAVVLVFRLMVRRPRGLSYEDAPGVRTVAIFFGQDADFFAEDRPEEPWVGVRLFRQLCEELGRRGIGVEKRGPVENAQGAECAVDGERFSLVLEWVEDRWVASVDWLPRSGAERRHVALTRQVFSPPDSPALRRLLTTWDEVLKAHAGLSIVRWHRKQDWLAEDTREGWVKPIDASESEG